MALYIITASSSYYEMEAEAKAYFLEKQAAEKRLAALIAFAKRVDEDAYVSKSCVIFDVDIEAVEAELAKYKMYFAGTPESGRITVSLGKAELAG